MKKLSYSLAALLLSMSSAFGQHPLFPEQIDSTIPSEDVIFNSFLLETVDPSVYPNQDDNFLEVTSINSGEWSDPTIWDCNCIPNSLNSVTIEEGHVVTVNFNVVTNTLHLRPDSELSITPNAGFSIEVRRDMAIYGTLNLEGIELKLNSTTPQQILGNVSPSIMRCEGVNEITNNGNLFIQDEFWVGATNFYTNDNMYVTNTASHIVEIAPVIFGAIHGDVTVTSEIHVPYQGWLSLGTPTTNSTVQNIVDAFVTGGFPGSDYPNIANSTVFTYVEESDDPTTDFSAVSSSEQPMIPGQGFYIYGLAGVYQYTHSGEISIGEIDIPVDYTNNDVPNQDGLNLIANPYPSSINWDSQEGWEKHNMSGVIYVWDASISQFKTYMNGLGTNGASSILDPMQAFWVLASDSDPTIEINEKAKAIYSDQTSTPSEFMKVSIAKGILVDELIITSSQNSQDGFDATQDAFKFDGFGIVPNISCVSSDGVGLAINDTPLLDEASSVSIYIDIRQEGDYALSFEGVQDYIKHQCVFVEDLITNEIYDLTAVSEFTFNSEIVDNQERFVIQIGSPITAEVVNVACAEESTGSILATGTGSGPWDYSWFDADMNLIGQTLAEEGPFSITDLAAGEYSVQVDNNDFCNSLVIKTEVTEPIEVIVIEENVNHIPCLEDGSGAVSLAIAGGVQPYFIEWENGELGAGLNSLDAGTYSYTLTDAAGCERTGAETVTEATDVFVSFTADAQMVTLDENGQAEISFTNQSQGATTYAWSFGESENSDLENPTYTYTQPGSYTVSLYATNGECDDYQQMIIIVEQHINVDEQELVNQLNLVVEDNAVIISSNGTLGSDKIEIVIYDLLGKVVNSYNGSFAENNEIKLSIDEANALYVVSVVNSSTGQKFRRKISRF